MSRYTTRLRVRMLLWAAFLPPKQACRVAKRDMKLHNKVNDMLIHFSTKNYGRSSPKNSYYCTTQNWRRSRANSDYRVHDPTIRTIVRSKSSYKNLKVQNQLSTVEYTIAPRPDLNELHDQCSSSNSKQQRRKETKKETLAPKDGQEQPGWLNPNSTPKTCFLCHL